MAPGGSGLSGNPASGFPSLINLSGHTTPEEVTRVVSGGQGMMPAFSYISEEEMQAVVDYLFRDEEYESEIDDGPFDSSIP